MRFQMAPSKSSKLIKKFDLIHIHGFSRPHFSSLLSRKGLQETLEVVNVAPNSLLLLREQSPGAPRQLQSLETTLA